MGFLLGESSEEVAGQNGKLRTPGALIDSDSHLLSAFMRASSHWRAQDGTQTLHPRCEQEDGGMGRKHNVSQLLPEELQ